MTTRKFKSIEYPVPGFDTAIRVLRPGARWTYEEGSIVQWEDPEGREPPSQEEINVEMNREVDIYNYYLYERDREENYPDIKEQLDLLYHDIKNGNLNSGEWITAIDAVKNKYPKPTNPEPEL